MSLGADTARTCSTRLHFHPSHTFVLLFSFMSSCLHVFHLILSFVCAHIGPGLSVYVRNYMYITQALGGPSVYNEVGFIVCPCALGSPFIKATCTFVPSRPLVMSSFFCPLRAHTCTFALTLVFTPPGEACVCVWPLVVTGSSWTVSDGLFFKSRGTEHSLANSVQRSYALEWDARTDHPCVPAVVLETLHHGPCF